MILNAVFCRASLGLDVLVNCQKGQRGYLATCLLRGHGFENIANLRGGFLQANLNGI